MLAILIDIVVGVLLLAGCLLALIAAVGLHRFPDLFCRMHAATKPATLGMLCIAVAVGIGVASEGYPEAPLTGRRVEGPGPASAAERSLA